MHAYWEHLQEILASGKPFAAVTLVDVIASAPANAGSKMLVTADGLFHGTVGGGKIEMKAIAQAQDLLAQAAHPRNGGQAEPNGRSTRIASSHRFVEWNLQRDVGMTCGGAVRLFFEVYNAADWPIVIFGAGHCAQALARLLLTLPCQLTVIDPRLEWLEKFPTDAPQGKLRLIHAEKPMADYVGDIPPHAFVLLMTMGHSSDQPILIEILKSRPASDFPYLGVIGSEAKAAALHKGLSAAGVPNSSFSRYLCPIVLPIGSNDPAEIAVSIAAQLLQRRDHPSEAST